VLLPARYQHDFTDHAAPSQQCVGLPRWAERRRLSDQRPDLLLMQQVEQCRQILAEPWGSQPARARTSGKLRPAASTPTGTSPGPRSGHSPSLTWRASGPPQWVAMIRVYLTKCCPPFGGSPTPSRVLLDNTFPIQNLYRHLITRFVRNRALGKRNQGIGDRRVTYKSRTLIGQRLDQKSRT